MRKELIEENVEGFGIVQASELTVAELAQLNSVGSADNPVLDDLLAPHGITVAALNKSLGLSLRDNEVVELRMDSDSCSGCKECINTRCPVGGYNIGIREDGGEDGEEKYDVISLLSKEKLSGCHKCGQCVEVCPQDVFELVYAAYRPSDLLPLVKIFEDVNPDFFLARKYREDQQKENLEYIRWEMQKEIKRSR